MTRITDEKNRVLLRNRFESRVLQKQEFGNGSFLSYEYNWPNNQYYPDTVVVTLPDQTKRVVRVAGTIPEYIKNFHR
jgi:hypothetical protein